MKEASKSADTIFGYFKNYFHGYAVENCLQILEMLDSLSPGQAEAKKAVEIYMEGKGRSRLPEQMTLSNLPEESLEWYLRAFMDTTRMKRAREISASEVQIHETNISHVSAKIKEYHLEIDLKEGVILHDCSDWSRCIQSTSFCKHVGKFFLAMPEQRALTILREIYLKRKDWRFEPYIT